MSKMPMIKEPQYWQSKSSGEILKLSGSHKPSDIWHLNYLRLRFLYHPESECVLTEDWYLLEDDLDSRRSALHSGVVEEISYEDYHWLKTLYDNPDL